jgi:type II secretory pathway pseudopilin PulG
MYKLALVLIATVATALAVPAVSAAKSTRKDTTASADNSDVAAPLDKAAQQKLKEHLRMRSHIAKGVKYPATKESIVTAFKGFKDVKPDDRKWFEETLPTRTYETSDDVMKALGWEVTPPAATNPAGNGK